MTDDKKRHIAMMALPYLAVLIGLYLFRSAWISILLYHLGIMLFLLSGRPKAVWQRLFDGWSHGPGLAAALLCAGCGPIIALLWGRVAIAPQELTSALAGFGLSGADWWLFAAYYVIPHPILEELFWRGPDFTRSRGLILADAAFGGYHLLVLLQFLHLFWACVSVVVLILVAWLWRRIAARYQGLAIPIISHAAAALSTMAAVYFLSRN
ncbi:MAG: hypothetical protein KJ970_08050 [Candidatus Eisenbacteria bacterium]|uniref:CAAX prenyl protease 2/Lysostaphin resistance protein A-like domain-containing protein n=1 Tax=Eiseniibacteriota bacterium TaxID=2212470 RepID=A0A948RWD1_UNCEI|nr:hypothetical protein [Candidatus Eisenbacteria bacterium]